MKCQDFSNKRCIETLKVMLLDWHPLKYSIVEQFFLNMRRTINFNAKNYSQITVNYHDYIQIHFNSKKKRNIFRTNLKN